MAKALQVFGGLWIAACVALWLYTGLFIPTPDIGYGWLGWTLPRMLADTRLGLTMVPIILAIPGVWFWQRGRKASGE